MPYFPDTMASIRMVRPNLSTVSIAAPLSRMNFIISTESPQVTAMWRALLRDAPRSRRSSSISTRSPPTAWCKAPMPSSSIPSIVAPLSKSNRTVSICPYSAAAISGVIRSDRLQFISLPSSKHVHTNLGSIPSTCCTKKIPFLCW